LDFFVCTEIYMSAHVVISGYIHANFCCRSFFYVCVYVCSEIYR
jgi:hypothetical protein